MARSRRAFAVLVLTGTLAACGGGSGETARDALATTTTSGPTVDGDSDDATWAAGEARLDLDGASPLTFTLDFCGTRPVDPDPGANTVTLQVDGAVTQDASTRLGIVETHTHDGPSRIQVVSVRFEDAAGTLLRVWEAQRVVDLGTGEVDDLHGGGTAPLLEVQVGDELSVTVEDATFWQFDMTGEDDRVVGTGSLHAVCRRA